MSDKFRKYIATVMIALVAFVSVAGGLFAPLPAHAQLATLTFGDIPSEVRKIAEQIYNILLSSFKVATVRTMAFVVRKVAYDSAVWLASGAKGQNPFTNTDKFGDYVMEVADQTGGTFIEQLGTDKLNLCHLPDIKTDLAVKVGLRTNYGGMGPNGPAKPDCSLSQMANNWGQEWDSKYGAQATVSRFNSMIQVDNSSDLGIQLQTTEKLANAVQQQTVAATLEREEGKGYRAKESPISGKIQTPPSLIEEQFKANTPDKAAKEDENTVKQALTSNDPGVLAVGLSIFLNTLASTIVTDFQNRGALPDLISSVVISSSENDVFAGPKGGAQAAADFYRELLTVKVDEVTNYDVLTQLSSCPDIPGTYNCRANGDLIAAVKKSETGNPITIGQALASGGLHGEFPLIPFTSRKNKENDCYTSGYCYSNIQVLRQLRILPLGFEIAAQNSDPDHPWTLQKVVGGFNDCQYLDPSDHSKGITNDPTGHPFCHLIDPDWVLKASIVKCKAKAPGPTLLSAGAPNRLEDCVDLQTCVHYAADGTCDNYGYCAREENTWKFNADKCDAYAATCRTFTSKVPGSRSVSYLSRTLDTGFCSEQNVGCTAYSLSQQNGKWQEPKILGANLDSVNAGIYFNKNVPVNCSANSQGCSAFLVSESKTNDLLYLKKAPDYLKCYDANPATSEVDWPESVADLSRIKPDSACKDYAGVCIKDEMSCSSYAPVAGGDQVPGQYTPHEIVNGQIKWNDECSAVCVGYAAYREMPSRFSNGQAVSYIIPSSGATCAAADEGCTAFTNLGTTVGGLEKTDYFTKLRPCVTPEKDKGKTYITYEGSRESGFQLKTYILVENKDTDNGPLGAPKYFFKDDAELKNNLADCTEERYKNGTAAADCRQFNDDQGHIYYRLLFFTIPVDSACTAYRLSNPELDANGQCLQNGELRDGSCFYNGLPGGAVNTAGVSQSCSATADTCRAFKGTSGGAAGKVFEDTFDSVPASSTLALKDWSGGITWSDESTHAGEHSLAVTGSAVKNVSLDVGASFDITFWAKGTGEAVSVQLKRTDGAPVTLGTISAGDTWNAYHLGPVEVNGAAVAGGTLTFMLAPGARLWIDNVTLNHSVGLVYLVKKSLSVDPACDSNLNDNLPGEALGCTAYTNVLNPKQPVYLTNFTKLCRAEAIGCTAVLDTKNTLTLGSNGAYQPGDEGARAYNVWLAAVPGTTAKITLGPDNYSCGVPLGATGCYLDKPILNHSATEIQAAAGAGSFVKSTVYIPGDTATDSPIYLVANKAAACGQLDLGCSYAGKAVASPTGIAYVTTTVKNDPNGAAGYEKTLCQEQAVGCQAYTDSVGSPFYFKDPVAMGQKICSYKTDILVNGNKVSGWFWKGVGVCSNNASLYCQKNTEASDCGAGNTCGDIDNQPCYPNFIENGGTYGLWSYGNTQNYQNFVGECKNTQDKCTEFVDHAYVSSTDPAKNIDQAYYLINDKSKLSEGDCTGLVSQKTGCVLLDQTENPNKYWSRELSYKASDRVSKPAPPVKSPDVTKPNDSNIIIKATPDRQCGEWLQCSHSFPVTDDSGKTKQVCQSLERCDKGVTSEDCGLGVKSDYSNQILTDSIYRDRDVTWSGKDYDGYSVFGMYPPEELAQVNFSTDIAQPDWRLAKRIPCGTGANANCAVNATPSDYLCQGVGLCGGSNPGLCKNGICVKEIRGGNDFAHVNNSPTQICRAYPDKTAPFPHTKKIGEAPLFVQANVCSESFGEYKTAPESNACECDYTKVKYGDIFTRYFGYDKQNSVEPLVTKAAESTAEESGQAPAGICQGGDKSGFACNLDKECYNVGSTVGGVCEKKTEERKFVGWRGFCLEPDKTRTINGENDQFSCLTWLPIDALEGALDIFNQHTEAGYTGQKFYCLHDSGVDTSKSAGISLNYPISPSASDYDVKTEYSLDAASSRYGSDNYGYYPRTYRHRGYYAAGGSSIPPDMSTFSQADVERIAVQSTNKFSRSGVVFNIVPNDFYGMYNHHTYQSYFEVKDNDSFVRQVAMGNYLERPNEFVMLVTSNLKGNNNASYIDPATGEFTYKISKNSVIYVGLNGNLFKKDALKFGSTSVDDLWSDKENENDAFSESMCPQNADNLGGETAWWYALRLVFDPNTHKLVKYYHAACDPQIINSSNNVVSDGSGDSGDRVRAAAQGGELEDTLTISFKIKEWCSELGDANFNVANNNFSASRVVAWTDRIWKQQFTIPDLNYKFTTPAGLFGSLSVSTLSDTEQQVVRSSMLKMSCPDGTSAADNTCKLNFKNLEPLSILYSPYSCEFTDSCKIDGSSAPTSYVEVGKALLGNIFAYLNNILSFSGTHYNSVSSDQIKNVTAVGDATHPPQPPQIRAVGSCVSERQCLEVATSTSVGFTINDRYNRDIVVRGNSLKAAAKFFAFADKEQMPIRQIMVDWDDGSDPSSLPVGYFRNQRGLTSPFCKQTIPGVGQGYCTNGEGGTKIDPEQKCFRPSDCTAQFICEVLKQDTSSSAPTTDFDKVAGQTCDTGYFEIINEHYYCSKEERKKYTTGANGECRNSQNVDFPNGCCVFRPKVQVKDNWGWCNGSCTDAGTSIQHPNGGCYDDSWLTGSNGRLIGTDECGAGINSGSEEKKLPHWTVFEHKIILAPAP